MGKLFNIDSPAMRFMARVTDIVILNTLFILTSLPIFTIGASVCALQTSIQKLLHKNSTSITKDYWRIFKSNFKQATLLCLGLVFISLVIFCDFRLLGTLPLLLKFLMGAAAIIFGLITAVAAVYGFAFIGRYENSLQSMLKNLAVLSLQNLFQTLFLLIFNGFILYFTFTSPAAFLTMLYLLTFGGFAAINLASGLMIKQVFDKVDRLV